ncbi:MAG: ABC transporter permease [Bacteroidales bacterium]|nr:ABC transporter permease [Bacteroidales bacterium]
MIRTYITIAFKYLVRQPAYSVLSILGFSLAFASLFVIYSQVSYQRSYDRHLEIRDRVYRLSGEINLPDNENIHAQLGPRLAPVMKEEIPAVVQMARLVSFDEKCLVHAGEQIFFEDHVYFADTTVFELFPLQFLYGTPQNALLTEGQTVISESFAEKYFGSADVLGRQLKINNDRIYEVTGVTKDLPDNVHHKLHMLLSMKSLSPPVLELLDAEDSENYWRPFAYSFILLGENNSISEVEHAFPAFYEKHMAQFGNFLKADFKLIITALPDLHFTPQYTYDLPKGNRTYSYLLMAAGLFLLLIALLNYTNLLSASLASRTHSLGIFKINGAERFHIFKLLITESLILIVIAVAVAWFMLTAAETWFTGRLSGTLMQSGFRTASFLLLTLLVLAAISLAFILTIISRVYRQPIHLLKGDSSLGAKIKRYGFGKGSIVIQFTFSVILIISSLLITRQVQYLLKAGIGFNTDNIVQVKLHAEGVALEKIFSFKQELKKSSVVREVAYSSNVPGEVFATSHFKVDADGQEASKIVSLLAIDADYLPLMQMELKEGRNFDRDRPTDPQSGVILNEACIGFLGMGDSLTGKRIREIEIIGVVKNGKFNSLHEESRPVALYFMTGNRGYMNVKLNTGDLSGALIQIQDTYEKFFDNIPFEYSFLDQTVEQMYRNDINQSKLLAIFTILSIVISNIGLFGLVSLLNRLRIREIGIRKVNGAHRWQIVLLLGKQLLVWVAVAIDLAIPVTWYVSRLWLQNFATRISFSWWIVLLGGVIILLSAMITTAGITLRASARNPVDTLRYE